MYVKLVFHLVSLSDCRAEKAWENANSTYEEIFRLINTCFTLTYNMSTLFANNNYSFFALPLGWLVASESS